MIYLSIVIPAFNASDTILPLVYSIHDSEGIRFEDIECIFVDDHSSDRTVAALKEFLVSRHNRKLVNVRVIRLKKNRGPAHARNVGVKYAKGFVVLFLDADVELEPHSLSEAISSFRGDPDLHALTGVWDKIQRSRKFFPTFKALRDWSYWINERDPRNYYYLFSTRVAAIQRDLFIRLGGFDETYKAALIEDIELTYRIAKRYAVVFNPQVVVHHEFEDFWPIAKKYFWRSYFWSKIYRDRKKFDPVATTWKEAMTTLSAGALIGLSLFYLFCTISILLWGNSREIVVILNMLALVWLFVLVVHVWGVRKFLLFAAREKGIVFAFRSFFTGLALYLVILAGASVSFLPINISLKTHRASGARKKSLIPKVPILLAGRKLR